MAGGDFEGDEGIRVLGLGGLEVVGQVEEVVVLLIFLAVLVPVLSECQALSLDKGEGAVGFGLISHLTII